MANSQRCLGCMSPLEEEAICPKCGFDQNAEHNPIYRKPGTLLNQRYLVGRVVRKNSEGATYISYDNEAQRKVLLREYFPYNIAQRDPVTGAVSPLEGRGAQYKALMSDFTDLCNEVKRLGVTEPVVPIEHVFHQDNTVYAVYRALKATTLESYLTKQGGTIPLEAALQLLQPLLSTVNLLHSHGQIHRGISPHTVYIQDGKQLFLGDFTLSATRTAKSELDAELFNGYSAPEQYAANGWQGTWTDVYAVGALLYRMVSGFVPPKSTAVGESRPLPPLEDLVMEIPRSISTAVANAMTAEAEDRTQSIDTFISQLADDSDDASTAVYDTNKLPRGGEDELERRPRRRRGSSFKYAMITLLCTVVVLCGALFYITTTFFPDLISADARPNNEASQTDDDEELLDTAVPRFVGLSAAAVTDDEEYRERFEFKLEHEYNEEYPEGVVYQQQPAQGTDMPNRGIVTLYVSKGIEKVPMPDLVGKTQAEATALLAELELQYNPVFINRYASSEVKSGTVLSTTPVAGTELDPKNVTVYVDVAAEVQVTSSVSRPVEKEESSQSANQSPPEEEDDTIYINGRPLDNFFHE